jgi:anti-anti-sigma factor
MNAGEFRVTADVKDPAFPVVTVSGEVDLAVAPTVRNELSALIARQPEGIIVDISDVPFMDSSGLNVFIVAFKALREYRGRLAIVASDAPIVRLFEIAGLSGMLNVVPTREAAEQSVRGDDGGGPGGGP